MPAYSSLPGAAATLYLDFDGHFESMWGYETGEVGESRFDNVSTPVFDLDGAPSSFNQAELDTIKQVWQAVSEDYAPFNINVTTVNPGDFSNGKAMRVAIGGSASDWFGHAAGGLSFVDSFTNVVVNTAYVFPANLSNNAKFIADGVSHESGHSFGLQHQSTFDASNVLVSEYNPGAADKAPIMGNSYNAVRSLWWNGSAHVWGGDATPFQQDDIAVIGRDANGFRFRADDYGNAWNAATPLTSNLLGTVPATTGIIGSTSDSDWFSFTSSVSGRAAFRVNVLSFGANLDAKLQLYKLSYVQVTPTISILKPVLVAAADPADTLYAGLTAQLTANSTYFVVVSSHGSYGDVGWYTLDGSIPSSYAPVVQYDKVLLPSFEPVLKIPDLGPVFTEPIIAKSPLTPVATVLPANTVTKISSISVNTIVKPTAGLVDLKIDPFAAAKKLA